MLTARQSKHTEEALLILKVEKERKKGNSSVFQIGKMVCLRCNWGRYFLLSFYNCILHQSHVDTRFPSIRVRWPVLAKSRTDFEAETKIHSDFSYNCSITLQFLICQIILVFCFIFSSCCQLLHSIVSNYTVIFLSLFLKSLIFFF